MGLTASSVGRNTADAVLRLKRGDRLLALAGNPNVGKSTLFNRLTGLRQHTGNWPGKTVGSAYGSFPLSGRRVVLADTPGAYSLAARSAEEALTRDFVCFGGAEAVLVVCDALCPERSLILALQILELTGSVLICMNLTDEAEKKGVFTDFEALSLCLGTPVLGLSARSGAGVEALLHALERPLSGAPRPLPLPETAEAALRPLTALLETRGLPLPSRWLALRLLEGDPGMLQALREHLGLDPETDEALRTALDAARAALRENGLTPEGLGDLCAEAAAREAEALCRKAVRRRESSPGAEKLDRVLTHPVGGLLAMTALLAVCLWLTVTGANLPSELLSRGLTALGALLGRGLDALGAPPFLRGALLDGVYTTVAWVTAVMLPPMAIFFPLFTLLEDAGFLPRLAFDLDGAFEKSGACGKQALTMCMGLGCNAAGVVGCRIIDSPREKLLAILTNGLMPCNGRFPAMIALITLFFSGGGLLSGAAAALGLTLLILLGAAATFLSNRLLTATLLRGETSAFTLELPPYRAPQLGKVLLRSVLDRTLFVLSRAVTVAAPAGLALWLLANLAPGGVSLLARLAAFLEPAGRLLGLSGMILLAFLLGLPANEIVLPIVLMGCVSGSALAAPGELGTLRALLLGSGWTAKTALCFLLFSLLHWPCSTTLLTVKKETGSWGYTLLAAALPTAWGAALCLLVNAVWTLFG